jgi:hypothetical protein
MVLRYETALEDASIASIAMLPLSLNAPLCTIMARSINCNQAPPSCALCLCKSATLYILHLEGSYTR